MNNQFHTYEVLGDTHKTEKSSLLHQFASWFCNFIEKAE